MKKKIFRFNKEPYHTIEEVIDNHAVHIEKLYERIEKLEGEATIIAGGEEFKI